MTLLTYLLTAGCPMVVCNRCGSQYVSRPVTCHRCLGSAGLSVVRGEAAPVSPKKVRRGVVPATELRTSEAPQAYPDDALGVWDMPERHSMVLRGPPGGGKSTLAARLAAAWTRPGRRALLVSAEEPGAATLVSRLRRVATHDELAHLEVSDAQDRDELADDLAQSSAGLVVLDSVSMLRVSAQEIADLLGARSWIAIIQINARGGSLGGFSVDHLVDAVVKVEGGVATPSKNRHGPMCEIRVF
jgi:predicted ATP-dependent serine protease